MRDLTSANAMIIKAALLAAVGAMSATLLFLAAPGVRTLLLIVLTVWAFARVYYFAFYVVEKYIDPSFRFSGVGSVVAYLWRVLRNKLQHTVDSSSDDPSNGS
ncbi:MAG TPA: hypothetical protein VGQ36_16155 [Thermoanaerobaculia bacterium]|nr:hypothetical protein [Thermoanaerobaculia bacterium]